MSDAPQLPPSSSGSNAVREPAPKGAITVDRNSRITSEEPVTITTTTSRGFGDIIPTILPALQSSSYVLVILMAFVAWSSRKLFTDFLDRHLELMAAVKDSLETERANNDKHLAILTQLTFNNTNLSNTVQIMASGRVSPSGNAYQETPPDLSR